MVRGVGLPALLPLRLERSAAVERGPPVRQRVVGDEERRLRRPAHDLLGPPHLIGAERRAVRLGGVALGGGGVGDVGPQDHERRAAGLGAGGIERRGDAREVVAVAHPDDVPSVGLEPALHVLGEGERGVAVDRDVVVVVDHGELAEPEMPGERRRLARDAFHEIAVAGEGPHPVGHHLVAGPVEVLGQEALGDRHPDRVRHALPQRAGGRLHAGRVAALRMPRRARAPLPERLDLLQRQVVPAQVEQRIEQHRRVAAGEHEAVAIGPGRIGGIVPQEPGPEDVRRGGERHRGPGMSGLGRLDRVHGQRADRVDAAPGQLCVGCVGVAKGDAAIGARGPGSYALCGQTGLLSSA